MKASDSIGYSALRAVLNRSSRDRIIVIWIQLSSPYSTLTAYSLGDIMAESAAPTGSYGGFVLDLDSSVSEEKRNLIRAIAPLIFRCQPKSDDTAEAPANFRRFITTCFPDLKLNLSLLSVNRNSRKLRPCPLQVSAIERTTR